MTSWLWPIAVYEAVGTAMRLHPYSVTPAISLTEYQ
jgi:hypothetical protein